MFDTGNGKAHRTVVPTEVVQNSEQAFPPDILPEPLRTWAVTVAKDVDVDVSHTAFPAIAAAGSCIANTCELRVTDTWKAMTIFWIANVMRSGDKKTAGFRDAIKPLHAIGRERFHEWEKEKEHHKRLTDFREAKLRQWKKDAERGDTGQDDWPDEIPPPQLLRHVMRDPTAEAAADILSNQWQAVLLAQPELSGFFDSFNQYKKGGADVAFWLPCYDAEEGSRDRVTAPPKHYRRGSVCITGTIQPKIVKRCLSGENAWNGMAARLLLAWPRSRRKRLTETGVPKHVEESLGELYRNLLALKPDYHNGVYTPFNVTFTTDAKDKWRAFHREFSDYQWEHSDDDALYASLSKIEGVVPRYALLHYMIRHVSGDQTAANQYAVDVESVEAGIAFGWWFAHGMGRIIERLERLEKDDDLAEFKAVVKRLSAGKGYTTLREYQRARGGKVKDSAQAELELTQLENAEEGEFYTGEMNGNGGRPSKHFRLIT